MKVSLPKKLHVKQGDTVMVISGKDAGKVCKVQSALPREGKIVVEGVNMVTRHVRPRNASEQGGRIEREGAIYASKVMLYCDKCKKPTRISKQTLADGTKVRVCKKCGETFAK